MSEEKCDYAELRREVLESRNQSIKTDNQIKNLSLDVKGFENRFDILERRLRFSQVGIHLIVAVTIAAGAYFVSAARTRSLKDELAQATQAAHKIQQSVATKSAELDGRLQQIEDEKRNRQSTQQAVIKLLGHLDKNNVDAAIALLDKVQLDHLSPLENRLSHERVNAFRSKVADEAYRHGRDLLARGRRTDCIKAFARSVKVQPKGRHAASARYLLGTSLREGKRYKEAVKVFRDILKTDSDKAVLAEVRYWEGFSLAGLGKLSEAKAILGKIATKGGKHAEAARNQLTRLEPMLAEAATPRP
jgi:TolA-binding protein